MFDHDDRHRQLLDRLSDEELEDHLAQLRAEIARLKTLLQQDQRLSTQRETERVLPLGKLRLRMTTTAARIREWPPRVTMAELELRSRRWRRRNDWDEPTETDLERLTHALRAS